MTGYAPNAVAPGDAGHQAAPLTPDDRAILWDMEERFWTSGVDNARATMARDAVMILPYPPGFLRGDDIWTHLPKRTGWRTVIMAERHTAVCGNIAILSYRVSAEKADVPVNKALCASTYIHDEDKWLRVHHQQTPVT